MTLSPEDSRLSGCGFDTPAETPSPSATESLIAKQLAQMSMEEREKVLYDIHGIESEIQETPQMLSDGLSLLEEEIGKIREKPAYEEAKRMNPEYVKDERFRLKFLRCDRFDPEKAAVRIVRHFEVKLELFGRELLAKDIVQDDLDKDVMDFLHSSAIQHLPERDHAGRIIIFMAPSKESLGVDSMVKVSRAL